MSKDFSYSVRSFLQNNPSNPSVSILKALLAAAFLGFVYFTYSILAFFFSKLIAFLGVLLLIFWVLLEICQAFTFPGGFWFWRRNVENYFQMAFVKKVQNSVALLKNLLEYLLKEAAWDQYLAEEELIQIRMMISSVMNLFKNQEAHGTLTKRQKLLLDSFTEIGQLLNDTDIINRADQRSFSLWSFLEEGSEGQESLELPNALLYLRDRTEGHVLLERCQKLEDKVNEITAKKGLIGRLSRWFFEDSFGTINQVREEIGNRYECKNISLQVDKKTTIDCVYIAGRNTDEGNTSMEGGKRPGSMGEEGDSNYYLQFASKGNKHLKTTVIICCPNTAYYEFMYYESEWIDIYVRNGLNVFLWNYRGYGRSTGTADLVAVKQDGEFIVDYLRKEVGVQQLGVHGEAFGGIIAAHLGKTKNIDFLCIDRNFSSLGKLGEILYGKCLANLYKRIAVPTEDVCSDYLDSHCYKLITFDAKEESVPLLASLKYNLTSRIIAQKLNVKEENINSPMQRAHPLSPFRIILYFKRLTAYLKLESYNSRVEAKAQEYYDLLSKEQINALFWAFSRVSELFISLSSIQNLPSSRKSRRAQSITHFQNEKEEEAAPAKPQKAGRRGSLDSSIINVSVSKETDLEEGSSHRKKTDESVLFSNESKLNETLDMKNLGQLDDAFLAKTIKRKSYAQSFDEEAKSSPDCVNLLVKVFATFEVLEAGGIQVSDVMGVDEKDRLEVFKHFINSFEIWGSYQPLTKILEDEPKGLSYHHHHGLNKLKEFIKKIDYIIQKQKQKPVGRAETKFVSSLMDDLEVISSVMPSLYQKLTIRFGSSSPTGESHLNMTGHDEVHIDVENAKQTRDAAGGKFIALKNETTRFQGGTLNSGYLGSLLPVTSGQGGSLQPIELEVYEYHLRNAKMIY